MAVKWRTPECADRSLLVDLGGYRSCFLTNLSCNTKRVRPIARCSKMESDDYRFYKLTPLLVRMSRLCDSVWGCVVNLPVFLNDLPTEDDFSKSRGRIFSPINGSSYEEKLEQLRDCLGKEEFQEFAGRSTKHFQRAIDRLLNAATATESARAARLIFNWIISFDEWTESQLKEYFGDWGRRFWHVLVEDSSDQEVARFARQFGPLEEPKPDAEAANVDSEISPTTKTCVPVTVITERFSVKVGDNECVLHNSKLFRILLALASTAIAHHFRTAAGTG